VTSAHVMAALALIIAMSGTAFAAIGSTGIQDNSIRSRDVRNNSLQGIDVRNGTLGLTDLSSAARTGLGSRLYHYDTPTSVNAISGTPTQIASLQQLEPGDYLVHATTSAFSASLTNTADCSFTAGGTSFGGSFTHIAIDNRYYHLADTAVVSLNATGNISYMCTFLTGNATAAKRQIMALKIDSAVKLL
jgi:hypothetical protein